MVEHSQLGDNTAGNERRGHHIERWVPTIDTRGSNGLTFHVGQLLRWSFFDRYIFATLASEVDRRGWGSSVKR